MNLSLGSRYEGLFKTYRAVIDEERGCYRARLLPLVRDPLGGFLLRVRVSFGGVDHEHTYRAPGLEHLRDEELVETFTSDVRQAFDAAFVAVLLGKAKRCAHPIDDETLLAWWASERAA